MRIILSLMHLMNRVFALLHSAALDDGPKHGQFLSGEDSLEILLSSKKSLIRWGDGESTVLGGGSLYFQQNTWGLFSELKKISRAYDSKSPYLIAMPNDFLSQSRDELKKENKYRLWRFTRYIYDIYFGGKDCTYLDSFIFRENSKISNDRIKKLWENESNIVFVHNNYKYFTDFRQSNGDKKVSFVQISASNTYRQRQQVVSEVVSYITDSNTNKSDTCVLVSAGPAGKVFTHDLCLMGYRVLDMGHYFDYKFYDLARDGK